MIETTPGPTPNRAVYGFAWFLFSNTLFVLYLFWAFVPEYIQQDVLGLTYLPDKYFAMVLPVWVLTALTFFAFFIYPPWNLAMQDNINDLHTIRDSKTIRRCQYVSALTGKRCEQKVNPIPANDSNNFNIWSFEKFCREHMDRGEESVESENDELDSFCDCIDKSHCLLTKNPIHLNVLRKRETVPSISDLDIVDVSEQLFLDD